MTATTKKHTHTDTTSIVSPYMTVKDVEKAADFYKAAFNFQIQELAPGQDGSIWHGELRYRDQLIMLGKEGAYGSDLLAPVTSKVKSPITLYLYCDNVDTFYQHAIESGAVSVVPPGDMFWGDRMCSLQCPDGYHWCFATRLS